MSSHSSKRSSISTIKSKSTRRSSSNLALIQEQSTPPTGSPVLKGSVGSAESPTNDDTVPLNQDENAHDTDQPATMADMEEGRKSGSSQSSKKKGKSGTGWTQNIRVILAHVGMVILCIVYAFAGATVFYLIEQPQEHHIRTNNLQRIRNSRDTILQELWEMTLDQSITQDQFRLAAFEKSDEFIKILYECLDEGGYMSPAAVRALISTSTVLDEKEQDWETLDAAVPDMWSFGGALLFATATLTTVGYGYTAPVTILGRLLCVAYGLFGIPLTLMTIADIGKFFGEGLKRLYRAWVNCRKGTWNIFRTCFHRALRKQPFYQLQPQDEESTSGGPGQDSERGKSPVDKATKENDAETKSKEKEENEEGEEKETTEAKAAEELAANVASNLPVECIFILIVAYTMMGAGLFTITEPWSILESFYFCFITMTTIGYGDFVPLNRTFFALTLLYIVLGLAITTMSIDQAGSEYIKKIHYFGRKIQSAKQALSNVRNMISYANWVKRRYGLTDLQLRQMTCLPEFYGVQELLTRGAFIPDCYRRLYFIDQRTESMLEEIFTITTLESEQEFDMEGMAETEFRSRQDTIAGSAANQSLISPCIRGGNDGPMGISKWRQHLDIKNRNSPSPMKTPSPMMTQAYSEMSHLERMAAIQRIRQAGGNGKFPRTVSGSRLLETSKPGSNNNNHSPKVMSKFKQEKSNAIKKQSNVENRNELDGSLIIL